MAEPVFSSSASSAYLLPSSGRPFLELGFALLTPANLPAPSRARDSHFLIAPPVLRAVSPCLLRVCYSERTFVTTEGARTMARRGTKLSLAGVAVAGGLRLRGPA